MHNSLTHPEAFNWHQIIRQMFEFNNAGIIELPKSNIVDNETSDFERVHNVNLLGAFLYTKHAARVMKPAYRGSIITTASICSTVGGTASHAYTSSKHGVVLVGLMRNAAVELGQYGIRVNCVSPYVIASCNSSSKGYFSS